MNSHGNSGDTAERYRFSFEAMRNRTSSSASWPVIAGPPVQTPDRRSIPTIGVRTPAEEESLGPATQGRETQVRDAFYRYLPEV
jgi:hypothetical protein